MCITSGSFKSRANNAGASYLKNNTINSKVDNIEALKQLQETFYKGIFDPSKDNIHDASNYILNTKNLLEAERLSIYRDSILGGISTALTHIYPVCVKLVGEKYFTHMVAGYLKNTPSNSPDIGHYGEHLSSYIANFEPAKSLTYLADVAQLEWLWHKAFNAPNDDIFLNQYRPLSALETVNTHDLPTIKFHPSHAVFLMSSPYPIQKIWQVNQIDYEGDETVNLNEGRVNLIIWRDADLNMRIDNISEDETTLLSAVLQQATFGDIAELHFSSELDVIVQRCIQAGFIIGIK